MYCCCLGLYKHTGMVNSHTCQKTSVPCDNVFILTYFIAIFIYCSLNVTHLLSFHCRFVKSEGCFCHWISYPGIYLGFLVGWLVFFHWQHCYLLFTYFTFIFIGFGFYSYFCHCFVHLLSCLQCNTFFNAVSFCWKEDFIVSQKRRNVFLHSQCYLDIKMTKRMKMRAPTGKRAGSKGSVAHVACPWLW